MRTIVQVSQTPPNWARSDCLSRSHEITEKEHGRPSATIPINFGSAINNLICKMLSAAMKPFFTRVQRLGVLPIPAIFLLVAIVLICWQASYSKHPGPKYYYSHFAGLEFATALAFDTIQFLAFLTWPWKQASPRIVLSRFFNTCAEIYWSCLAISGLVCAISYSLTPKPAATAIQVLIFLNSTGVLMKRAWDRYQQRTWEATSPRAETPPSTSHKKRILVASTLYANRTLKTIRFILSAFFIAGAVGLARQYRFPNPGTISHIVLASGSTLTMNHYCTAVPPINSSSLPTIWFESSAAHGITDFLGVQTVLAEQHGRNSCSYDPPNFGWSGRWLSSEPPDLTKVFGPLLRSTRRENEAKTLVGWGGGGENVLRHAREDPSTIKAVVLLDVAPTGIEWLDQARARNLSMDETVALAKSDIAGRASLAQIILAIALPWGVLPLFIPFNNTGYFNKNLYPRHYAQPMKEDMWTMQYYSILDMLHDPFAPNLENLSTPEGVPVFMLASYVSGTDEASNAFYREEKLRLGRAITHGDFKEPVTWCTETDCDLSFPVTKSVWTANALVDLGI